jgi:hypothetical protein
VRWRYPGYKGICVVVVVLVMIDNGDDFLKKEKNMNKERRR